MIGQFNVISTFLKILEIFNWKRSEWLHKKGGVLRKKTLGAARVTVQLVWHENRTDAETTDTTDSEVAAELHAGLQRRPPLYRHAMHSSGFRTWGGGGGYKSQRIKVEQLETRDKTRKHLIRRRCFTALQVGFHQLVFTHILYFKLWKNLEILHASFYVCGRWKIWNIDKR